MRIRNRKGQVAVNTERQEQVVVTHGVGQGDVFLYVHMNHPDNHVEIRLTKQERAKVRKALA